jgi:hypothetical protein
MLDNHKHHPDIREGSRPVMEPSREVLVRHRQKILRFPQNDGGICFICWSFGRNLPKQRKLAVAWIPSVNAVI